jgi:hypothetical protein
VNILVGVFGRGPCTHDVHTVPIPTVTFRLDGPLYEVGRVEEELI